MISLGLNFLGVDQYLFEVRQQVGKEVIRCVLSHGGALDDHNPPRNNATRFATMNVTTKLPIIIAKEVVCMNVMANADGESRLATFTVIFANSRPRR